MGFISKLFRNGRLKFDSKQQTQSNDSAFQPQATEHQFDKENIRFIIFRDHDLKGRSVLFDSLKDGSTGETQTSRSSSDLKKIADMMFGTLPLSHKTTTFKVHSRKSPPQLMITKVFIPERRSRESTYSDLVSFDLYSIESLSADDHVRTEPQDISSYPKMAVQEIAHSMPLDVPKRCFGGAPSHVDDLELSTSGTHSLGVPSVGSVVSLSSSYSSRDRRRQRHKNTMIEHLLTSSLNDERLNPLPLHKRPTKIGIAVIFLLPEENSPANRCFQSFFFSHIMLIENYVHQLKGAIDQALAKRSEELICKAITAFLNSVSSLYKAPRLKDPAWLSMMTYSTRRFTLSSLFLKDFVTLVEKCHTKNTKFFFGVLITAVLTHHLSWAPTVAPVEERPSQTYLDKHAAKWVNSLLRSHPYNPLWAQLGDLYGAVGVPLCLSRTVVVGRKQELVGAILFILSYFIRCSEILENVESFPNFSNGNHSCSSSETSSIIQDDEATLKSPMPCSDDGCACMLEPASVCTASFPKQKSEKSSYGNVNRSDSRVSDLDECQCCPGFTDCAETGNLERNCHPLMLFVKPPSSHCLSPVSPGCPVSHQGNGLSSPLERHLNLESPSSNGKKKRSLLSLQLEQPCRLKEDNIVESPRHEFVRNVGSAFDSDNRPAKTLHRVTLGDQDLLTPANEIKELDAFSRAGIDLETVDGGRSGPKPMIDRGISMFDEYFESHDPEMNVHLDGSFMNAKQYDNRNCLEVYNAKNFDDIMEVPCPDVTDIILDQLSRTTATVDTGLGMEESTELYDEHFGDAEIEDVIFLTDDPSKQNLYNAISRLQDHITTSGHSLEGDRLCLSGDGMYERSVSYTKSKKKHNSGQLTAMSSSRCRSVTLSESSYSMNNMTNYVPLPMPSSSELSATDMSSGCIYLSEECNFGRSLLGDYCSSYTSHFVLHGTGDREFLNEPYTLLNQDLRTSVQNSVLDEPVAESTCIVADTDEWSVQLFSCKSKYPDEPLKPLPLVSSSLVCNLIESVYELAKLKMSPEFCLLHLEDQLQSIYLKSQRLAEYIRVNRKVYSLELATLLNIDINDMPLLLAISRTHSPQLFRNL